MDSSPVLLDPEPLQARIAALETLQEVARELTADLEMVEPFKINLNADTLKSRFDRKTEGAVFSIVQEAVNNVKKHANPQHLDIDTQEKNGALTLLIHDDGRGFDFAQTKMNYAERGSLGLLNMAERAEIAHGMLDINSKRGQGTRVKLVVPLPT